MPTPIRPIQTYDIGIELPIPSAAAGRCTLFEDEDWPADEFAGALAEELEIGVLWRPDDTDTPAPGAPVRANRSRNFSG